MKKTFVGALLSLSVLAAGVIPNMAEAINLPYHTRATKKILCYLSAGGQQKGWIDPGDDVIINQVSGNWAYVNYPVPGGRANRWIVLSEIYTESNNGGSSISNRVGQIITNTNGYWYTNSINPFSRGQCTWYAFGRFGEVKNYRITFSQNSGRHAKNWYNLINNCGKGTTITPKCVAVRLTGGGGYGHVVFVEDVDSSYVYYTDANAGKPAGTLSKVSKSTFLNQYKYFIY